MQSCDTFVLGKNFYTEDRVLFAKNSDRPLGEAQPLVLIPAKDYADGETVTCTHLTIPQVTHTYGLLGSSPYWIWGFEMGMNDQGLVIGNEAQGSRCDAESEEGLLGMDILRLALERSATAREGVSCIASLLETYGQNANASMLFDRRYENSFLLADKQEIWLMETAGRQWVARQITDWAAISNCYSIGTEFDLCSADAENYAKERRWLRPGETFDFAKAYTKPAVRQTASVPRWRRLCQRIRSYNGAMSREDAKTILRDHFEGELIAPRFGAAFGNFVSICMHAMTWDASQTAASMLWHWDDTLGHILRWAPSIPCCSVYLPVYWTGKLPKALTCGGGTYDEKSLWWNTEALAMLMSVDEDRFGDFVRSELRALEVKLEQAAQKAENTARELMQSGETEIAKMQLQQVMEQGVSQAMELISALRKEVAEQICADGGLYGPRKEFLEDYCERTKLQLL